ncbi:hypothetical protein PHYSODRAFT_505597, partial [Phytophthora sojae]
FVVMKARPSTVEKSQEKNLQDRNGFTVHIWQDVCPIMTLPSSATKTSNVEGWNQEFSGEFLRRHFGHRPGPFESILLLWDDFNGHQTEQVRRYATTIKVLLLGMPSKATSVYQPADIA